MIFRRQYDNDRTSVLDTFIQLGKEIILLDFVPIIAGDASDYKLLKEIP